MTIRVTIPPILIEMPDPVPFDPGDHRVTEAGEQRITEGGDKRIIEDQFVEG